MTVLNKIKVVMIPNRKLTPNESIGKIFLNNNNVTSRLCNLQDIVKSHTYFGSNPQELYFLRDEKINVGDWYMVNGFVKKCVSIEIYNGSGSYLIDRRGNEDSVKYCIKIVGSTDKLSLYNNESVYLPSCSLEFIDEYIDKHNMGNPITEVMVEYEVEYEPGNKPCDRKYDTEQLKIDENNCMSITMVKNSWDESELKDICLKWFKHEYSISNRGCGVNYNRSEEFDKWLRKSFGKF